MDYNVFSPPDMIKIFILLKISIEAKNFEYNITTHRNFHILCFSLLDRKISISTVCIGKIDLPYSM